VNLGIADQFLSEKSSDALGLLADFLAPTLIENLFDMLVYSGTQKKELFDDLSRLACGWTHREIVITNWHAVCYGLTKRLINIIYNLPYEYVPHIQKSGDAELEERLSRTLSNYVVVQYTEHEKTRSKLFNVPEEHVLYLWFRLFFMFEKKRIKNKDQHSANVTAFSNGKIYMAYLTAAGKIQEEFTEVGKFGPKKQKDIYFDPADILKAGSIVIKPKFVQSGTYKTELCSL